MKRSIVDKLRGRNKPQLNTTDTLIDEGTEITGQIGFTGTLLVHGKVIGGITSGNMDNDDTLVITPSGTVRTPDIPLTVKHIIVQGDLVAGGIRCSTMEVTAGGRVTCTNLQYKSLKVMPGAQIIGNLVLDTGQILDVEKEIAGIAIGAVAETT